jgi:hypothetical protein
MLIHPQPFFYVPLGQGARGQVYALRVLAGARDRGIVVARPNAALPDAVGLHGKEKA